MCSNIYNNTLLIPSWKISFLSFVNATIGLYVLHEQSVDTSFKLTIVKFFGFKAKSVRKSLTAEPNRRYSARSKYHTKFHNATQKAADSNRRLLIGFFALQLLVRRVWMAKKA